MKTHNELMRLTLKAGLAPIPKISVSEWADKYRQLPSDAAEPGRWKTSRVPYMREVMDAFTDPNVEKIVVKSAAQVGKSEVLLNVIGRYAHVDPSTIMIIQPTLEMAQDFSKSRVSKMIADSKILTPLFYGEKTVGETRNANQTILSKFYRGGRLVLAGANSPAGLASRPIRILLLDEVDRFPQSAGGEGDPISIAEKRTSTYFSRKIGIFSTPTVEGLSRIDVEYALGTQEEWQHQCPNCLEWHTARIADITKELKWRCPDCGREYDELAVKRSKQRYYPLEPINLQTGVRSFFITGFYSPWVSWRTIRQELDDARGKPDLEKVVCNTRFGISYEQQGDIADADEYLNRLEKYDDEIPRGVLLLTAGVDVQHNRLEYEICGWGADEECWGICRGQIINDPQLQSTWDALDAVLDREYRSPNGALKVVRTFIDSGFMTSKVYDYCAASMLKGRLPIKGIGQAGKALLYRTTYQKGMPLTMLGVNEGKAQVYARLQIKKPGAQYFHFGADDAYLLRRYDEIYFKQLMSERRVLKRSGGMLYETYEPVKEKARNEALDLRVYALGALKSMGDINWERLDNPTPPINTRPSGKKQRRYREADIW